MKNLQIFASVLLMSIVFFGCEKEKMETLEQTPEFQFSKTLTISDVNGNSVNVELLSNNETLLSHHDETTFELVTTTRDFSNLTSNPVKLPTEEQEAKEEKLRSSENLILVNIVSRDLANDVTGFAVRNVNLNKWDLIAYEYGVNDIIGAYAKYETESCTKERLDVDLDKKTASSNWFWQDLSSATLYSQGDEWLYAGATKWSQYRFRYDLEKTCNNSGDVTYYWFI
jgi:hypothetical protein